MSLYRLHLFRFVQILSLSIFGLIYSAQGQTFRGGISGIVLDPTGATVQSVEVKATNDETGLSYTTSSSSAGEFIFQDLPLGVYAVSAKASGFRPLQVRQVPVTAGTIYNLSLNLSIANADTALEVSAANLSLDTATAVETTVLESKTVQSLPLNGRDFQQLLVFSPGFAGYPGCGLDSVNGSRGNQKNWQIDGSDNNDLWHNHAAVNQSGIAAIAGTVLPLDSIEQFSLQTQSGAETGRNSGGTINLVVKSGTNQIHGSAYYYNRNEAFAAKSPFVTGEKPEMRNDQFGLSLGGPILKNKTFYFLSFERQKFVIGQQGTATEPSQAFQNQALALLQHYGVTENPVSQKLLQTLWPTSALTGPATGSNYYDPEPQSGYSNNGIIKLDHSFNSNNNIAARWFVGQGNQIAPEGSALRWYYMVAPIHVQNYSVVYNHNISNRLTNQVLFGVNYFNQVFDDSNTNFDPASLGFNTGSQFQGAPNINISGFDSIGVTAPSGRNDVTGHLTDTVSFAVGRHQFRFGGEVRQARVDEFYFRHSRGSFNFSGQQGPWAEDASSTNVKSLADFLAGNIQSSSIAYGNQERKVTTNTFDLFFHDTFQLTRRLSVNYGVRYDYVGPFHDDSKDLSTFIPGASKTGLVLQGAGINSIYPQRWTNFSPRLGFAYQPKENSTFVVRGGFGIFFDTPNLNPFLDNRPGNNAANGVEGNPIGANPVQSVSKSTYSIVSGAGLFDAGTTPPIIGIFSVDQRFRTPYSANYNLNVEKSLGSSAIAQIGYVGGQGRRLISLLDINQASLSTSGADVTSVAQQASRPYYSQFANYGNINQVESIGTSNYNSLQATLKTRNWHHLYSQFSYTWSHSLDEVSQYRGVLPQNSFNFKGEYGNSDFDTRHNFTTYLTYDVPSLSHAPRWLSSGWQLSSLLAFHTGQPFSVVTGSADSTGTGEGTQRADIIGDPLKDVPSGYIFNPAAFATPANGTFGNQQRNQIFAPGYGTVDLSVLKNTAITERFKTQIRAELFNLFNRTNLATPNNTIGTSSFGKSTDTIGDSMGAPGIGPGEPFNVQLALKIIF